MKLLMNIEEKLVPALFGGLAIFLISYLIHLKAGDAIIFASLGASTVILSGYPDTRMAKLRVVILAYLVASIIGYGFSFMPYLHLAAGLSVFFTITKIFQLYYMLAYP